MQVSKKESAEMESSLKVSWGEGLIVPSFSHQEFNFAFSLSVLRYTCSYSALVTFSFFSSTWVERQTEWEKSGHGLNHPAVPCQRDFCLKFDLYPEAVWDLYSWILEWTASISLPVFNICFWREIISIWSIPISLCVLLHGMQIYFIELHYLFTCLSL